MYDFVQHSAREREKEVLVREVVKASLFEDEKFLSIRNYFTSCVRLPFLDSIVSLAS